MKVAEALKAIDRGWVKKPGGFRVHFQLKTDQGLETDHLPGTDQNPFDSDVVAWRTAWKLYQVSLSDDKQYGQGKMVNIYVVDDQGKPVKYYANGKYQVYNPCKDQT